jgi:NAD(P)-dependent dehydrogenase (short-subunit alcohol dehydrogenase family)
MDGQTVLVTGAKGGLGAHITRLFLENGAFVAGSSRGIADGDFSGSNFAAFPADLLDCAQAGRLADAVVGRRGGIDALVHVTGGFAGGAVHETDEATWDQMMNVNLRAAFHAFRAVIPHMRKAGRGRIVAIGSKAAVETAAGIAAYAASKAALVSLVRSAALENKDAGITANAILPGTIDTAGNNPEWVSPERIAALAWFLISDAGSEISGAALPMYGGV